VAGEPTSVKYNSYPNSNMFGSGLGAPIGANLHPHPSGQKPMGDTNPKPKLPSLSVAAAGAGDATCSKGVVGPRW
jgi:hypothetical protein